MRRTLRTKPNRLNLYFVGAMIVAKKKAILYYANPDYASDVLAAWQSCIYRPTSDENTEKPSKSNATPNSRTKDPKKDCEIIVINDSDDETPRMYMPLSKRIKGKHIEQCIRLCRQYS